ncbi:MAG: DUF2520 domain-containing protein [Chitinophagales bacterium]
MKISIIGTGKAATALTTAFIAAGQEVVQAWAHSRESGNEYADRFGLDVVYSTENWIPGSDVVIVALRDDVVQEVLSQFSFGKEVVALTSGIQSRTILDPFSAFNGIFYPFVSMTKTTSVNFSEAVMMIEGNSEMAVRKLSELAHRLSQRVMLKSEQERRVLHVAAVISQNFTNHLWVIASQLLEQHELQFDLLKPLLQEHFEQVLQHDPRKLQTGPAVRGDQATIAIHRKLLSAHSDWLRVYDALTLSIQENKNNASNL